MYLSKIAFPVRGKSSIRKSFAAFVKRFSKNFSKNFRTKPTPFHLKEPPPRPLRFTAGAQKGVRTMKILSPPSRTFFIILHLIY
jgi:hypothetical protein